MYTYNIFYINYTSIEKATWMDYSAYKQNWKHTQLRLNISKTSD